MQQARLPITKALWYLPLFGLVGVPTLQHLGGEALIFTWILLALAIIDSYTQLLPDFLTFPLLILGLTLKGFWLGAIVGYLSLWAVNKIFYLIRKQDGIGQGDFKLLAALGAWLGPWAIPQIILIASFTGSVFAMTLLLMKIVDKKTPIPFGPFLALGGWGLLIKMRL